MDNDVLPDRIMLRKFGLLTGGIISLVFGTFLPLLRHKAIPTWPWVFAVFLWALAILAPERLHIIYRAWMRVGEVLGRINTAIILSIVYYLIVTPMGLTMRAFGRDPMLRKHDPNAPSYRITNDRSVHHTMEVPF